MAPSARVWRTNAALADFLRAAARSPPLRASLTTAGPAR